MNALVLRNATGTLAARVETLNPDALPGSGGVRVEVAYSSLNYKDGLAVTGRGKVVRGEYPFVPGIDLAGTVVASDDTRFAPGSRVVATGWGLGETHWGGFAQQQRVQADGLVALPETLSLHDAMALGTAGLTAMLSLLALEAHALLPGAGDVVVTGASGGVGSLAVLLLAEAGHRVVASSGKAEAEGLLKRLGAQQRIGREVLGGGATRPLETARWAGAVDTVGGATLAALLSGMQRHASVAACGLAGGAELHTTVMPFILRGVNLLGIDSNTCPQPLREHAWRRLARLVPRDKLAALTTTIPLADVPAWSEKIVGGGVTGRVVVDVNA